MMKKVTIESNGLKIEVERVSRQEADESTTGYALNIDYYDGVNVQPHYLWIEQEDDLVEFRNLLTEYINLMKGEES